MTGRQTADYRNDMGRLVVGSVLVPFLFVIVMSGVEYLATPKRLWELMTDVGWDLRILGLAVTGGIFATPEMERGWGLEGSLLAAVMVIAVNLLAGMGIQVLRRNLGTGRFVGSSCLLVGVFTVSLPSVLTYWR